MNQHPPAGLIPVPLGKGCVLLLTPAEMENGIRRGKGWRRRQTIEAREQQPHDGERRPGAAVGGPREVDV